MLVERFMARVLGGLVWLLNLILLPTFLMALPVGEGLRRVGVLVLVLVCSEGHVVLLSSIVEFGE
jgi:hypothetical protein